MPPPKVDVLFVTRLLVIATPPKPKMPVNAAPRTVKPLISELLEPMITVEPGTPDAGPHEVVPSMIVVVLSPLPVLEVVGDQVDPFVFDQPGGQNALVVGPGITRIVSRSRALR